MYLISFLSSSSAELLSVGEILDLNFRKPIPSVEYAFSEIDKQIKILQYNIKLIQKSLK